MRPGSDRVQPAKSKELLSGWHIGLEWARLPDNPQWPKQRCYGAVDRTGLHKFVVVRTTFHNFDIYYCFGSFRSPKYQWSSSRPLAVKAWCDLKLKAEQDKLKERDMHISETAILEAAQFLDADAFTPENMAKGGEDGNYGIVGASTFSARRAMAVSRIHSIISIFDKHSQTV